MATFVLFLVSANLLHFHLNRHIKAWFVVGILRFQKWFDLDISDFQLELCYRFFGSFWFGNFLGYFLKNWHIFS
jgi:hypothetical protein